MTGKYGTFTDEQLQQYNKKLHSKIHWLLVYKESQQCDFFDEYCQNLLEYINSLNEIVNHSDKLLDLMVLVQMAYSEGVSVNYSHKTFRKHVLEAHQLIDTLWGD